MWEIVCCAWARVIGELAKLAVPMMQVDSVRTPENAVRGFWAW